MDRKEERQMENTIHTLTNCGHNIDTNLIISSILLSLQRIISETTHLQETLANTTPKPTQIGKYLSLCAKIELAHEELRRIMYEYLM